VDTVLVVDGLFLHRDELAGCSDFSVFLTAPFAIDNSDLEGPAFVRGR
jgi:uridine kinase